MFVEKAGGMNICYEQNGMYFPRITNRRATKKRRTYCESIIQSGKMDTMSDGYGGRSVLHEVAIRLSQSYSRTYSRADFQPHTMR